MFLQTSASTSPAVDMEHALWEPASAILATKEKTAKKWTVWTQPVQGEVCAFGESATVLWDGEVLDVRVLVRPVWSSALDTGVSWLIQTPATVTTTGPVMTAPQSCAQRTVVDMASVWRAAAGATRAGWAPGVSNGLVTLAAANTGPARTESANAARDGMENTALSRAALVCAMAMADARWVIMAGTAFVNWAGGEQAATHQWRRPAVTARTMMEMG